MKLNDVKHNHSLTDLLKVILFALMMLLPFLDVGTRCSYVIANKNAYQSYSGEPLEYETTQLTSVNDMDVYDTYMFTNLGSYSSNVDTNYIGYTDISNIETNNLALKTSLESGYYFRFTYSSNNKTVYVYDDTLAVIRNEVMNQQTITFNFVLTSYQINSLSDVSMFYTFEEVNNSYLDNVFEYSISKLEESNLYNWTTQTAIYNGVSQMTTQLGITTKIIPIIVCYWFFITIIYIILDIVIRLFTMLTHAIGSKTSS